MPSAKQGTYLYYKLTDPKGIVSSEFFEIQNLSSLLIEWQKARGLSWQYIAQIVGIPPGADYYLVEWDSNKHAIKYTFKSATSPTSLGAHPPAIPPGSTVTVSGTRYNTKTESVEETAPPPLPPRQHWVFTILNKDGAMVERDHYGTDLTDIIRVNYAWRPGNQIISISYKGDVES